MEKKELEIPQGEILERLWVTSDKLYLVATSKRKRLFGKPIGADLISIGGLKGEIKKELDKAREEGRVNALEEIKESMECYLEEDTSTYEMVILLLVKLKTKEDGK